MAYQWMMYQQHILVRYLAVWGTGLSWQDALRMQNSKRLPLRSEISAFPRVGLSSPSVHVDWRRQGSTLLMPEIEWHGKSGTPKSSIKDILIHRSLKPVYDAFAFQLCHNALCTMTTFLPGTKLQTGWSPSPIEEKLQPNHVKHV